ncbi:MAG TPA: trehalose-phosphatase [Croceibacterium sp.]|nr:trehalose-phosphatase [Croceibacterium sp.]
MPTPTQPLPSPPTNLLRDSVLFLDFDGTLVELAPTPDAVRVDDRLVRLLSLLSQRLDGRIAIVSGRPVAAIREFLPIGLAAVGSHGMEFGAPDGAIEVSARPEALAEIVAAMEDLSTRTPGTMVEDKPLGAVLHYRLAPEAEAACMELATTLADEHGLHLQPGKMMVEVRAPGGDKGSAIERLMREPELRDARPIFMGDDLTDEPGFAAAARLGGAGILVGAERPSSARYRLASVQDTLSWLEAAAAELA